MQEGYLTTRDAAARLGLAPATLTRWRWAGRGPRYLKLGGAVRYDVSDLDEFAATARRQSTSAADPGRRGGPR